jgi:amino acid transporter
MKKISTWARVHKRPARIAIVVSFILLNILGIMTGVWLAGLGVMLSYSAAIMFVLIYSVGLLAYPSRLLKNGRPARSSFYIRQKTCDALLATATFCLVIYLGNRPETILRYFSSANAAMSVTNILPKDSSARTYKPLKEFSLSMKDGKGTLLKWKERKKLLKEQVKAIKKSEMSSGGKVALIILSVLLAVGLIYLVAALACSLSCNGSEAAAVIVGIAGTGLVIFLLVIAIKAILGKEKKRKRQIEAEEAKKAG